MANVLAFMKTYWVALLSGLAALVFMGVGVLGMMSDSVVQEMQQRVRDAGPIGLLRSSPKNPDAIRVEAERGAQFQEEYERTRTVARRINERKPLLSNVFPVLEGEPAAYEFRDAYVRAVQQLPLGKLQGGDRPGERDVQEAREEIQELALRQQEEMDAAASAKSGTAVSGGPPRPSSPTPVLPAPRWGAMVDVAGAGTGPQAGDPGTDERVRAAVTKARSIRCYVSSDPARPSFHFSPIWDRSVRPTPEDMWYAQVGLWIQQDIVDAIADLNDEAARPLKPDEVYVENMPVKRLQSVRVFGYVTTKDRVPFPMYAGMASGAAAGDFVTSFTGRKSAPDSAFDVVQFQVTAVVDQRALLRLIDRITKQNFYKLVSLNYLAVKPGDQDYTEGYMYGAAPVVRADLIFEGYLARDVYEPLFPAEVRERLGLGKK